MPRKPRKPRIMKEPILPALRYYFETGEYDMTDEEGACEVFLLQGDAEKFKALWRQHREEIIKTWKGKGLPWAAAEFDH